MKKRIAAAVAAIILLLSGCQATPEKGVVTSKNDGAFEAALEDKASPTVAPEAAEQPPTAEEQSTPAPTVLYEDSFDGEQGGGGVKFHVRVTEPTVPGPMPVLRVRPLELTGELVHQVAQVFYGDSQVNELTGQMTRAELEEALLAEKQEYADWQYRVEQDPSTDADDQDYVRASFEERIARLEEECAAAPETIEQKPLDWQFHGLDYYPNYYGIQDDGRQSIQGLFERDGETYELLADKRLGEDYKRQGMSVSTYIPESLAEAMYAAAQEEPQETPAVDMDAARATALELAADMDIGEWAAVPDIALEAAAWHADFTDRVVLTPVYNGVPLTYHIGGFTPTYATDDAYATNYGYESMSFSFDKTGVTGFGWESMHQVVEAVNENVALLPFADILTAAENQMRMTDLNRLGSFIEGAAVSVEVTDVVLGLSRIRVKDSSTDYYLTPTYTFYGVATVCDENGEPIPVPVYDEQGNETGQTAPIVHTTELAVINAVDGTAIDVYKGY